MPSTGMNATTKRQQCVVIIILSASTSIMKHVFMKRVCRKIVSLLGLSFASPPMSEESLAAQSSVNATNSVSTLSELPNAIPTIQIDPPSHMSSECLPPCSFLDG